MKIKDIKNKISGVGIAAFVAILGFFMLEQAFKRIKLIKITNILFIISSFVLLYINSIYMSMVGQKK